MNLNKRDKITPSDVRDPQHDVKKCFAHYFWIQEIDDTELNPTDEALSLLKLYLK